MKTSDMKKLIALLKEFKMELEHPEDKRDINVAMRMVSNTIDLYSYKEELSNNE